MLDFRDKAVPEADTATANPTARSIPEIKAQATDAIFGPVPLATCDEPSTRRALPLTGRLWRYGRRATLAACLFGLAWTGGSYYSRGYWPFDAVKPNRAVEVQQDARRDEMLGAVRQMAEEMRALKASVEAMGRAKGAGAEDAKDRERLNTRLDSMQNKTNAAFADLAGRLEKLDRESTTKLSQLSQQLAGIEHQIAAPRSASVSRGSLSPKRTVRRHDAFDPSLHPTAPGAPRSLGSLVNTY